MRICELQECDNPHYSRGWCNLHYKRWKRWGDPRGGQRLRKVGRDDAARFEEFVTRSDGCWLWNGAITPTTGYGAFRVNGRTVTAHVFAHHMWIGPVADGLQVDHVCHSNDASCSGGKSCVHRRCVNPSHLEAVTQQENIRRGRRTGR